MSSIMNVFAVWMVAGAAIGNPNVPDTSTAKSLAKSMVPKQTASGGAVRRDKSWTSAGRKNAQLASATRIGTYELYLFT